MLDMVFLDRTEFGDWDLAWKALDLFLDFWYVSYVDALPGSFYTSIP